MQADDHKSILRNQRLTAVSGPYVFQGVRRKKHTVFQPKAKSLDRKEGNLTKTAYEDIIAMQNLPGASVVYASSDAWTAAPKASDHSWSRDHGRPAIGQRLGTCYSL